MSRMPPWPVFTSRASAALAVRPLLDPPLQGLDAADVGLAQVAAIDPGLELFEKLAAQVEVAGHGPGLDVAPAAPRCGRGVVVVQARLEADDHRPALPLGPQPQVDAIGAAQLGRLGQQPHDLAGQAVEELDVGDRPRAVGLAVAVVEEDQVDVAGIVQFQAAELAHAQHDEPRRAGRRGRAACRAALELPPGRPQGGLDDRVGQVGDLRGDGLAGSARGRCRRRRSAASRGV